MRLHYTAAKCKDFFIVNNLHMIFFLHQNKKDSNLPHLWALPKNMEFNFFFHYNIESFMIC